MGRPPSPDLSADAVTNADASSATDRGIDAVIFDFTGVLTSSPGEAMKSRLVGHDIDLATMMAITLGPLHEDGNHPWHELERGTITMDAYQAAIEVLWRAEGFTSFPGPPPGDEFLKLLRPVPEMIDAARAVRSAGYRTAILTNNVREWSAWREQWDADDLVDVVVDSSEVGLRKPDPAIFELTLQRLGGPEAGRTLFLDDFPWNIAAADALGMQTMQVVDPVDAAAALVERLL